MSLEFREQSEDRQFEPGREQLIFCHHKAFREFEIFKNMGAARCSCAGREMTWDRGPSLLPNITTKLNPPLRVFSGTCHSFSPGMLGRSSTPAVLNSDNITIGIQNRSTGSMRTPYTYRTSDSGISHVGSIVTRCRFCLTGRKKHNWHSLSHL